MIDACADGEPSLVELACAVLLIVPQLSLRVGEEMCTEREAPLARSPKPHDSTPAAIAQSGLSGSSVQLRAPPAGSVSSRVTPRAMPSPLLVTVIVKPILSPALKVPLCATFVIALTGQLTVS